MSDYFHYNYQCPYITGTKEHQITCEGGSMRFTTVSDCREFLLSFCANEDQTWKSCTIACARTQAIDRQIRIRKDIREWQKKQK